MTERQMQTFFGEHLKKNPPRETEVYELKICRGNCLGFDEVKPHQIQALIRVRTKSLYHRITDQPWIEDRPHPYTLKKPFDCFCLVKERAFLVVWFYKPRQRKIFIKIPIEDFIEMRQDSKRKSFTEGMALQHGEPIIIN